MSGDRWTQRARASRPNDCVVRHWRQAALLALGAWLLLSPFALDYAPAFGAAGNAHLVGGALALLALAGLVAGPLWGGWAQLALGLWLMASAFVLGPASAAAYWNLLGVGTLVVILGLMVVFLRPAPARRRRA